jgi:transposase InsO family protein
MIESQYHIRINTIHYDNGTKYSNEYIGDFLKEKGIQYLSICYDTP